MPNKGEFLTAEEQKMFQRYVSKTFKGKPVCIKCKWWEASDDPEWTDDVPSEEVGKSWPIDYQGLCRRMPPIFDIDYGEGMSGIETKGWWPITEWNDWCGEFKKRRNNDS